MNICKTCIMPDTRPDTPFVDGECAACINYAARPKVDWKARREALKMLVQKHRHQHGPFDCIVPSSGGKDSTYQVLRLIDFGLRPLVVTAGTCHKTSIGRGNVENLAAHATTWEITPNQKTRAYLNREALKRVGDISWPEHVSIFTIPWQAALASRIPLLFYGENPQNQYGGPWGSEDALTMSKRWRSEFGGFLGLRPADFIGEDGIEEEDMAEYTMPSNPFLDEVEVHFLGQYLPWDSHENAKVAIAGGMVYRKPCEANWWEWENLDNAQTGLHDWFGFLKYGYTRGQAQISVDIRAGLIARDVALGIAKKLPRTRPAIYAGVPLSDALQRIGLNLGELIEIEGRFTNEELQAEVSEFWRNV